MTATEAMYRHQQLWLPEDFRQTFIRASSRLVGNAPNSAFKRQIDLWWFAFCLGVDAGRRTNLLPSKDMSHFAEADILASDPWRQAHLELVTLGIEGVDAVMKPSRVIVIGNEYALTGFRLLENELRPVRDYQTHLFGMTARHFGRSRTGDGNR